MFRKEYTSAQIVAGLMSGDKKIYQYLDAVYRKQVIKHVRANSGSLEDGEELYQDVVMEVIIKVEQDVYDEERSKFHTYFMMISRSRWKDRLRKRKRAIQTTSLDESYEQISDFDEAEQNEQDLYYEQVEVMSGYISRLPEDEQEMIRLFYFAKKSLKTIAQEMGITYEYAKQKLYRIRKKLREMLDNDPNFGLGLA